MPRKIYDDENYRNAPEECTPEWFEIVTITMEESLFYKALENSECKRLGIASVQSMMDAEALAGTIYENFDIYEYEKPVDIDEVTEKIQQYLVHETLGVEIDWEKVKQSGGN